MASTGLDTFDSTIQETNVWLKGMMQELATDNRRMAYDALRGVLHALRDRIGPENAVHLGAQLPMLVRGLYYEGWRPAGTPTHERHLDDFLDHVAYMLPRNTNLDPGDSTKATFKVLAHYVDPGEIVKVIRLLPREVRALWPESVVDEAEYRDGQLR